MVHGWFMGKVHGWFMGKVLKLNLVICGKNSCSCCVRLDKTRLEAAQEKYECIR